TATTGGPTTTAAPTTGAPTATTGAAPTSGTTTLEPTSGGTESSTGGGEQGGLSERPAEPIVLVGGQIPGFLTADKPVAPGDLVGFAWTGGAWKQVPIQVDERVLIDFCTIYAKA